MSVEVLNQPISVNWAKIIEPTVLGEYPGDDEVNGHVDWITRHDIEAIQGDEAFKAVFEGVPLKAAVALVGHQQHRWELFHHFQVTEEPASALIDLAGNSGVCEIMARHELILKYGIAPGKVGELDGSEVIKFGRSLWMKELIYYDEYEPIPGLEVSKLADRYMPELVESFREGLSEPMGRLPKLFTKLAEDPRYATGLCQAILKTEDPLNGFLEFIPKHEDDPFLRLSERLKRRSYLHQFMREALFSHPDFDDHAHASLRTLVGDAHITGKLYDYWAAGSGANTDSNDVATLEAAGINPSNEAIQQLTDRHAQVARSIIACANKPEVTDILSRSSLDFELAKSVIGWRHFEWGEGTSQQLQTILEALQALDSELLTSRHAPSATVSVSIVEKPLTEPTQDMLDRLEILRNAQSKALVERLEALQAGKSDHVTFTQEATIETIQGKIKGLIADAYTNLPAASPQKQKAIEFQVARLEALRDYDFASFPSGISDLAKYKKDLGSELITLLCDFTPFAAEFHDWDKDPNLETLAKIIENWEHNVVTLNLKRHPDLDHSDKKAILDLLSAAAFKPLFEGKKTGEMLDLQFVPVRGLLLEASGHIAHACWAEKYDITKAHPNIDALLFVQKGKDKGPNAPRESFAGACLLIHAETLEGEPVLIVRGLNPSQSLIDKIDAGDFYDKLTAYVRAIAAKDGRKPAIVIDNKVGNSASNRPKMHSHLKKQHNSELKVPGLTESDITFNGYEIAGTTYYLP